MRHWDNLSTFSRLNHFPRDFSHRLFVCLISAKKNNQKSWKCEDPSSLFECSLDWNSEYMALKKIHHTDAQKKHGTPERICTLMHSSWCWVSGTRWGRLTQGVTTPIKSHLDALHIFTTGKMLPRFWGGNVNCGGGRVIQVEDAVGVIEVASVINRRGLARADSWFIKSTFLPLIL